MPLEDDILEFALEENSKSFADWTLEKLKEGLGETEEDSP